MTGYHMTKEQAERLVALRGAQAWEIRPYPDRHGLAPAECNYGVFDLIDQCWVFNAASGGTSRGEY